MSGGTVSIPYIRSVVETAASLVPGLTAAAILARAGIGAARLAQGDGALTLAEVDRVWAAAAALTGDPALGIEIGRRTEFASFGLAGQVMATAPDLGAALRAAMRFTPLIGEGSLIGIAHEPGLVLVTHRPQSPDWPLKEMRVDAALAAALVLSRLITGTRLAPAEVRFERAAPRDSGPWAAFFAAPLRFGAGMNALAWTHAQLATPARSADEALHALLLRHAEGVAAARLSASGAVADLRLCLQRLLAAGEAPTIERAAAVLNASSRSLQRALADQGTSFTAERDALRLALARRLLADGGLGVEAVARRLGFAEAAVFVRAFRRWTGETPARWRRVNASGPSAASSGASGPGTGRPA
ncbi:AraC family transcriptional regulator [Zavarzinia compransoris]|uniref:HTH araC/xylS-type domain-containing protein n=1 Tax=Zavarzinia compransoris TaxID=1264899 RepID=A0A317E2D3_9PROT|nr:AraC family transcriptional regulator [Zavarzinia compransoris]PWR20574.1 hypothetical protein DKG75_11235 [Zavarzinia compransoris]TDP43780.1 AraC family transcriptional regulator [Zavarzinia compransoris]